MPTPYDISSRPRAARPPVGPRRPLGPWSGSHRLGPMAAALTAAIVLLGCGEGPPTPADPDEARRILEQTLAAWRDGQTAEELRSSRPPVVVSDHGWTPGRRLVSYRIASDPKQGGQGRIFDVVLQMEDRGKRPRRQAARYCVGTSPVVTVVRDAEQ